MIERFPRLSSLEFFDRNLSGHFCADENRNRRVSDADSQPGAPRPPGLDVMEAGLGIRPSGRPAARGLSSGGYRPPEEGPMGDLTMRNRSMFRHVTLYAIIFVGLSIAAAPLVLLALFFF